MDGRGSRLEEMKASRWTSELRDRLNASAREVGFAAAGVHPLGQTAGDERNGQLHQVVLNIMRMQALGNESVGVVGDGNA